MSSCDSTPQHGLLCCNEACAEVQSVWWWYCMRAAAVPHMSDELLPGAQPSLRLIILTSRVHGWTVLGCSIAQTAVWTVTPLIRLLLTPSDDSLLSDEWTCDLNASPFTLHVCAAGCSVTGRWAKHVTEVRQVTVGAVLDGSQCSHVERLFLSCGAALVARAGVRCAACVGACERAVSDYSGEYTHTKWVRILSSTILFLFDNNLEHSCLCNPK